LKRVAAAQSPSRWPHSIDAMASRVRKRLTTAIVAARHAAKMTLVILLVLPVLILGAIQLKQYFRVRFRHPVTVVLRVEDINGHPMTGVDFRFREKGTRYLVPNRFYWSPSWHTKGTVHKVTTDSSGMAFVSVRDQMLSLEAISVKEKPVKKFMTLLHRSNGWDWGRTGTFEYYGYDPRAKDPWTNNYTVTIK